jgi:ElaA protein
MSSIVRSVGGSPPGYSMTGLLSAMDPIQHDVLDAPLAELDPATLYRILQLRSDVFVVEQNCVYADLDGRDLEPSARQLWIERDGAVLATLRLLTDPNGEARIGRVVTATAARGQGLSAALLHRAIALAGGRAIVLAAQSHLEHWYARFGFVRDGAEFIEDGIPHVPMRRLAGLSG